MRVAAIVVGGLLAQISQAHAGAWPQPEGTGFFINDVGYAAADNEPYRLVTDGYGETGLGGPYTAVVTFDSTVVPDFGQSVWHATAGIRYSLAFEDLPRWEFSAQPILGYQFHQSPIADPAFAGDGWSYGGRVDAGYGFELFDLHGFADIGLSATTRSQADGVLKLEGAAGLDLSDHWQVGLGYYGDYAPGTRADYGAYQKLDIALYVRWRFEPEHAITLSVARTLFVDRTVDETTFSIGLWTYYLGDTGSPP